MRYDTAAAEFLLRRWTRRRHRARAAVAVPDGGPRILLCTARLGAGARGGERRELVLARGQALWLAAADTRRHGRSAEPGTQLFLAGDGLDV